GSLSLCDALIHNAAIVDYGSHPKNAILSVNVDGTKRILRAAREVGVRKSVYVGSIAAYGTGNPSEPVRDESSINYRPRRFLSPYELSKYMALLAIKSEFPETVCIMPGVVYGPGSQIDLLLRLVARGMRVFVGSDNRLPFVHVDDTADGIIIGLENAGPGDYLCVSDLVSARELGFILARLFGRERPVLVGPELLKFLAGPGPMFLKAFGINSPLNPCSIRTVLGDWGLFSEKLMSLGWRPRRLEEGLSYLRDRG
ncbi:MAG: NAD-dependent epimerase/dehydratase family protein, partial [Candidatus Hydrothermia bacterium]